jgi:DNA modification methylase
MTPTLSPLRPHHDRGGITIYHGDCREILPTLPERSVQTCVTSPPYWGLRDYGVPGQIGSESTIEEWVDVMWRCSVRCGGC